MKEKLAELLTYEETTGILYWKVSGKIASIETLSKGYATVYYDSKEYQAHQVIWFIKTGVWPAPNTIDHKDTNGYNNRWANLRECNNSLNAANSKIRNSHSGFKGVYKVPSGNWSAKIQVNNVRIYLGTFNSKEEAVNAYAVAARKSFGPFARTSL